jgi:hypothetical protein
MWMLTGFDMIMGNDKYRFANKSFLQTFGY